LANALPFTSPLDLNTANTAASLPLGPGIISLWSINMAERRIQVLGVGCPRCRMLAAAAAAAVRELGLACAVEKVTAIDEIVKFDAAMMPALVIDGVVKAAGKVPEIDEIKDMLRN
jgi:small redox-active disulfide protein 2